MREAEERAQRNAESDRRAAEALDRLRPILGEHGVHPDTVAVKGHGVWLTPEVAETISAVRPPGWAALLRVQPSGLKPSGSTPFLDNDEE